MKNAINEVNYLKMKFSSASTQNCEDLGIEVKCEVEVPTLLLRPFGVVDAYFHVLGRKHYHGRNCANFSGQLHSITSTVLNCGHNILMWPQLQMRSLPASASPRNCGVILFLPVASQQSGVATAMERRCGRNTVLLHPSSSISIDLRQGERGSIQQMMKRNREEQRRETEEL